MSDREGDRLLHWFLSIFSLIGMGGSVGALVMFVLDRSVFGVFLALVMGAFALALCRSTVAKTISDR